MTEDDLDRVARFMAPRLVLMLDAVSESPLDEKERRSWQRKLRLAEEELGVREMWVVGETYMMPYEGEEKLSMILVGPFETREEAETYRGWIGEHPTAPLGHWVLELTSVPETFRAVYSDKDESAGVGGA